MSPGNHHAARRRAILTWLAAAVALGLCAAPALANDYYVSPTGSSANAGTSPASPWSLAKALSSAVSGDNILLADGAYAGDLHPANSGAPGARITFIGDLANPSAVTLSGNIDLIAMKFITVKGVSCGDIYAMAYTPSQWSEADSVLYCVASGSLDASGAQSCHFAYNRVGDGVGEDRWQVSRFPIRAWYCTFRHNVMRMGGMMSQPHAVGFDRATWCEFTDNKITITMPAGAVDVHGHINYGVNHCLFRDNKWMMTNLTSFPNYLFNQRDSCRFNTYLRDTVLEMPGSTTNCYIRFATAGSYPGSNGYNTFIQCYFRANFTLDYQNDSRGDTWFGCTLVSTGLAMDCSQVYSPVDSLTMRHCTFFTTGGVAMDMRKSTNLRFVSNVIYSKGGACPGIYMPAGAISDSNLVFQAGGSASGAIGAASGACSAVGPGFTLCTTNADECHSAWGSPSFADSSYASFNGRPRSNSLAIGPSWVDGYVGALPFGVGGLDTIPPGRVTDLATSQVLDRSLVLGWTAPGDNGFAGVVEAYDLRYSTNPITDATFGAATAVSVPPQPVVGGTTQTYVVLGLNATTRYFFALKARDATGNWSALSNVASATTAVDTTPPATIQDLRIGP